MNSVASNDFAFDATATASMKFSPDDFASLGAMYRECSCYVL